MRRPHPHRTWIVTLLSTLALLPACSGGGDDGGPRNLVLITVDTLRVDRLGCYGYEDDTSPHIDRFAEGAVRFSRAFSTSSFTPPSHASILTSQYVGKHKLLTWNPLDDSALSMAEILRDEGYATGAFVNLGLLQKDKQNLGQGFEEQIDKLRPGPSIVAQGMDFIERNAEVPFFAWLHFYDVHRPYGGPMSWRQSLGITNRMGDVTRLHYGLEPHEVAEQGLTQADLEFIASRYDIGLSYLDQVLEPLLTELSSPHHLENTMVVFTADHGENLLEYPGWLFAHDPYLYPEVTHIPMMMRFPGGTGAGEVHDGLISLIDVAPTVLTTLGVPRPDTFQGVSILPGLVGQEWPREELYMECWGWRQLKAICSGDDLVIYDMETKESEFVDLSAGGAPPSKAATSDGQRALAEKLGEFVESPDAAAQEPELSEETLEQMRELGYID